VDVLSISFRTGAGWGWTAHVPPFTPRLFRAARSFAVVLRFRACGLRLRPMAILPAPIIDGPP
jgi:hypothetical protein